MDTTKTKLLRLRNAGGIEGWYTEAQADQYKETIPETGLRAYRIGWTEVGSVLVDNPDRDNADKAWAEQSGETPESPAAEKKGKGK